MRLFKPSPVFAALVLLGACAASPTLPPVPAYGAAAQAATRYKAVLIAGDSSLPVFDNAVEAMASILQRRGGTVGDVQRLSADPAVVARPGVRSATFEHVLDAIAAMKPGPGQGCLVFATSHGAPVRGVFLAPNRELLAPASLDRALAQGCGNSPTIVVVSACFSGSFAQAPMRRPNRVVLTAARADRASFGCGAGRTYTVYDRCLLDAIPAGGPWQRVQAAVRRCVAAEEHGTGFPASEPQAWFGAMVKDMDVPGT